MAKKQRPSKRSIDELQFRPPSSPGLARNELDPPYTTRPAIHNGFDLRRKPPGEAGSYRFRLSTPLTPPTQSPRVVVRPRIVIGLRVVRLWVIDIRRVCGSVNICRAIRVCRHVSRRGIIIRDQRIRRVINAHGGSRPRAHIGLGRSGFSRHKYCAGENGNHHHLTENLHCFLRTRFEKY